MSRARDIGMKLAKDALDKNNNFIATVSSGSKGDFFNIAFLYPATLTFFPLVDFNLDFLFIMLILVTLTLNIFSILFFKFFLFALSATLNTILFCDDRFVDFSVITYF